MKKQLYLKGVQEYERVAGNRFVLEWVPSDSELLQEIDLDRTVQGVRGAAQ